MSKSPIEAKLREAIIDAAAAHRISLSDVVTSERPRLAFPPDREHSIYGQILPGIDGDIVLARRDDSIDEWTLIGEVGIGSYRADFLIFADTWALSIECDGHDFHDRTKQQAAYDRSRDRELLIGGVHTIRFTGSEIVHSPERCATDVFRVGFALREAEWARIREWNRGWDAGFARGRGPDGDQLAKLESLGL